MKNQLILFSLLAIVLLLCVFRMREGFRPEFLDESSYMKTLKTQHSSYAQETNHFKPVPAEETPIPGQQTPHRVNMAYSYRE